MIANLKRPMAKTKEQLRLKNKAYYEKMKNDSLFIEKRKRYLKEYYQKNKERLDIQHKEYRNLDLDATRLYFSGRAMKLRKDNPKIDEYSRRLRLDLEDSYILTGIKVKTGLCCNEIKKYYPELIENYRQQIKLKRLIKFKKNEQSKTR